MKKILDYYMVKDAPQDEIEQFLQRLPMQKKIPSAYRNTICFFYLLLLHLRYTFFSTVQENNIAVKVYGKLLCII